MLQNSFTCLCCWQDDAIKVHQHYGPLETWLPHAVDYEVRDYTVKVYLNRCHQVGLPFRWEGDDEELWHANIRELARQGHLKEARNGT